MAESATADVPTSIVNTPEPPPAPTPEATLFKTTPGEPTQKAEEKPGSPEAPLKPATEEIKPPTDVTKPGDTAKPAPPATPPTDYELKLPKDSVLNEEDLAAIAKEAKDAGLTKEKAEEVLNSRNALAVKTVERMKTQQETAWKAEQVAYKDIVAKDPEMGGEHLTETVMLASRGFKATASPELQKLVDQTGLGSHPEYVRQMAKIGRMMAEDKLVLGQVGGAPESRDAASVLYARTTPGADGKKPG